MDYINALAYLEKNRDSLTEYFVGYMLGSRYKLCEALRDLFRKDGELAVAGKTMPVLRHYMLVIGNVDNWSDVLKSEDDARFSVNSFRGNAGDNTLVVEARKMYMDAIMQVRTDMKGIKGEHVSQQIRAIEAKTAIVTVDKISRVVEALAGELEGWNGSSDELRSRLDEAMREMSMKEG